MKLHIFYPSDSSPNAALTLISRLSDANRQQSNWKLYAVLDAALPDDFYGEFVSNVQKFGFSPLCAGYADLSLNEQIPASAIEVCELLKRTLADVRFARIDYAITERINDGECSEYRRRIVSVKEL